MAKDIEYKVVCAKEGKDITTNVDCSPAELLGIIQHLVDVFAKGAGITYNQVLEDIKEKED